MSETERHSIVWQECGTGSRYAERFYVPGYEGYLPFFIWGQELEQLEKNQSLELREGHLLKGILYGLYEFDHNPKPWHQQKDRETLLYLLDVLGNGFKYDNPEKMILDIAFDVREKNGNGVSRIILEVGNNLIPQSSKIKSDLVCDLWAVISEKEENKELLNEIITLIHQMDLSDIHSDAKEIVCYYGLCALVFLNDNSEISEYLPEFVYPNVEMRQLKDKIKALLENRHEFRPMDLKIV